MAPVAHGEPVPCDRTHTAITFRVGDLDTIVDGHLVSVDSQRVQTQVARECPAAFDEFVGGTDEDRRLTMLRPVWFTPSLQQSDRGANWYRCDAVAIASDEELAPLVGRLQGVLGRPLARERYAICGTAAPDSPTFERVICAQAHAWKAIGTVDVPGTTYPGVAEGPRRRPAALPGRRERRRRRPAQLPVGLRVADGRAVEGRPALRAVLGSRTDHPSGRGRRASACHETR